MSQILSAHKNPKEKSVDCHTALVALSRRDTHSLTAKRFGSSCPMLPCCSSDTITFIVRLDPNGARDGEVGEGGERMGRQGVGKGGGTGKGREAGKGVGERRQGKGGGERMRGKGGGKGNDREQGRGGRMLKEVREERKGEESEGGLKGRRGGGKGRSEGKDREAFLTSLWT